MYANSIKDQVESALTIARDDKDYFKKNDEMGCASYCETTIAAYERVLRWIKEIE